MKLTTKKIGSLIRESRKQQNLTQADLALACGFGLRFIIELEKGKQTCQIEKVLHVLQTLGFIVNVTAPNIPTNISGGAK